MTRFGESAIKILFLVALGLVGWFGLLLLRQSQGDIGPPATTAEDGPTGAAEANSGKKPDGAVRKEDPIAMNNLLRLRVTCRVSDGTGFMDGPAPECTVALVTPAGLQPVSAQAMSSQGSIVLSIADERAEQASEVAVTVPGYLLAMAPIKNGEAQVTVIRSARLSVAVLGTTEQFFDSVPVSAIVSAQEHGHIQADTIRAVDGSYVPNPVRTIAITGPSFTIPDLPTGIPCYVELVARGTGQLASPVLIVPPASLRIELEGAPFLRVVCDEPVTGAIWVNDRQGRLISKGHIVAGNGYVRSPEGAELPIQILTWGEGWKGRASGQTDSDGTRFLRVEVERHPTYSIELHTSGEYIVYYVAENRLTVLPESAGDGLPSAFVIGTRCILGGLQAGTRVVVRCPESRVVRMMRLPSDTSIVDADMRVSRCGLIRNGIESYAHLRRMYYGLHGATFEICAVLSWESAPDILVPMETLYFFEGGMGAFQRAEAWWYPEIMHGRYCAAVTVEGGKMVERVDLDWHATELRTR